MIAELPPSVERDTPPRVTGFRFLAKQSRATDAARVLAAAYSPSGVEEPTHGTRPALESDSDHRDMRRLLDGEEQALQRIMERYSEALYGHLARVLKNHTEAQDCVQEVFIRVYCHRDRFDFSRKFSTWLYAIAFNLARDQLRRRARRPAFLSLDEPGDGGNLAETLLDPKPSPDERLDTEEFWQLLSDAIATLPEPLRQPLVLSVFLENSYSDIAARLHCSVKAVEMRIYHARKSLIQRFEQGLQTREGFWAPRRNQVSRRTRDYLK